ncbi:beta-aspartyl-peptidase [Salisediminibacterium selenitireducens]|uniref:Isoaspartyl dipeptidase n=1 Tax=Bacillus selenitireducens (strain ATCC 700615 / DSM 15326 / MLS10) TaxID=439292 RepID=D6Y090_BACIE|nr:beta-aspartyl-peptidase [Salisediminibacterium selenitireducens]ADH98481.1 isoaspartyl dipeptidase [[Bacillus] selenitireducens MLS10]
MILLKNGEVFAPEHLGKKDILIAGGEIVKIGENLHIDADQELLEVVDATGQWLTPGLIDGHVHITGGGGEGSFHTRTPELMLSACIDAGVTTVVGVIGTDGTTRTMTSLVAKAKGLTEEGISCYCQSGNYHVPVRTLTGSIQDDIMLIQEIIGTGEIAIADHRSSQPTAQELARLASESRIGGILSGKGGVVNVHIGDGKGMLSLIEEAIGETDIPRSQFWPTHINRTEALLNEGFRYAKEGGVIDFTTSSIDSDQPELRSSRCLKRALDADVPISQITFTSDAQGSLPRFDNERNFIGLGVGQIQSLLDEVRDAVQSEGLSVTDALKPATENPARVLKLMQKGRLKEGLDADVLLMDPKTLTLNGVMAKGKWLKKDGIRRLSGTFEEV